MQYTVIIRKSRLEYVGICLDLNLSARGDDLAEVERNLRAAIELYLEDVKEHPETVVQALPMEEFIEFLRDTEPEWFLAPTGDRLLRPLEIHEVPSYA